ncbi:substrate-binding domain-containing protein [Streptacidiphilus sp. MAP5-3]|uniref:substrate-binding domain-containing protein n=1 Tax=unclassified Streptacidiphilus TaxID=2643834 RepID=UPI003518D1BA
MLLAELRAKGSIRTSDLVKLLGVSDVTVRKDVDDLVRAGLAQRFHGGVTLPRADDGPARSGADVPLQLGVLLPDSGYFRAVLGGVGEAVARFNARQSLVMSRYNDLRDMAAIRSLVQAGCHGLVLVGPTDEDGYALFPDELLALPVPVVLVERRLDPDKVLDRLDHVISDHVAGARLAVEYLAGLGHRRIALVTKAVGPTKRRVVDGYQRARRQLALDVDLPVFEVPQIGPEENGADQRIADTLDALCRQGVTAVVVHSDPEAVMLSQFAQARGLRIPQDLAIVSYDDDVAGFAGIPLSAIAPAKRAVGSMAVDTLVQRIRHGAAVPVRHVTLQPGLVVRDSCGAPSRRRRPLPIPSEVF